jgi:hypothetical protein
MPWLLGLRLAQLLQQSHCALELGYGSAVMGGSPRWHMFNLDLHRSEGTPSAGCGPAFGPHRILQRGEERVVVPEHPASQSLGSALTATLRQNGVPGVGPLQKN